MHVVYKEVQILHPLFAYRCPGYQLNIMIKYKTEDQSNMINWKTDLPLAAVLKRVPKFKFKIQVFALNFVIRSFEGVIEYKLPGCFF